MDLQSGMKAKVKYILTSNGEHMIFESLFYTPKLKTNIFSLGKLDNLGFDIDETNSFNC